MPLSCALLLAFSVLFAVFARLGWLAATRGGAHGLNLGLQRGVLVFERGTGRGEMLLWCDVALSSSGGGVLFCRQQRTRQAQRRHKLLVTALEGLAVLVDIHADLGRLVLGRLTHDHAVPQAAADRILLCHMVVAPWRGSAPTGERERELHAPTRRPPR